MCAEIGVTTIPVQASASVNQPASVVLNTIGEIVAAMHHQLQEVAASTHGA